MPRTDIEESRRMRLHRGAGEDTLCIWAPFVVRSPREASRFAREGCDVERHDLPDALTPFLACYGELYASTLGQASVERGRIVVHASGQQRAHLDLVHALASQLGLSTWDSQGDVQLHWSPGDLRALWTVLDLVEREEASCACFASCWWQLHVSRCAAGLRVCIELDSPTARQVAQLRLLGLSPVEEGLLGTMLPSAAGWRAPRQLLRFLEVGLEAGGESVALRLGNPSTVRLAADGHP